METKIKLIINYKRNGLTIEGWSLRVTGHGIWILAPDCSLHGTTITDQPKIVMLHTAPSFEGQHFQPNLLMSRFRNITKNQGNIAWNKTVCIPLGVCHCDRDVVNETEPQMPHCQCLTTEPRTSRTLPQNWTHDASNANPMLILQFTVSNSDYKCDMYVFPTEKAC